MHPFLHLSIVFWLYTALQYRCSMSSNFIVFHTSGGISSSPAAFRFLIFLRTKLSSSPVNYPSLMSNCLVIIFMIGSCVTFGGFPSKFSKCCFHSCIRSWLVAFRLAFATLFLLLTSFTVCRALLDCLSSTESLILSIWFCMYFACSFRYMLANSFCAFLSFRALILVGFFLLYLETVFSSARFSLTTNVSHETLGLALCLIGMHSAATSKWTLTKISYSSFGVCVSVFSCSASNLFLSIKPIFISNIPVIKQTQLQCTVVVVRVVFLRRLSRIFAVTIRWSEDKPLKEEYASQFNALLFHFLVIFIYLSVL